VVVQENCLKLQLMKSQAQHEERGVAWQAFAFPVSGDLWKVSYRLLATTSLDGTSELSGVVDTEKYYQSITTDGTTSGDFSYMHIFLL
jgi:hypothetical protein